MLYMCATERFFPPSGILILGWCVMRVCLRHTYAMPSVGVKDQQLYWSMGY